MQMRRRLWIVVLVLIGLLVGCAPPTAAPAASGGESAAAASAPAAEAPAAVDSESVEGWGGGYDIVPPELCPPVTDDADVEKRVRPPIFRPVIEEKMRDDEPVLFQQGLYVNDQGDFFRIEVAGANRSTTPETIFAYSGEVLVCFDQILVNGMREEMAASQSKSPAPTTADENGETPEDPEAAAAESLVISIQSVGFVPEGDVPTVPIQELTQKIVDELSPDQWVDALTDRIANELGLKFVPTEIWTKENQQDTVVDFIIDPRINKGRRHQYSEVASQNLNTTVHVGGNEGAGRVSAGLCSGGVAKPFTSATVDHTGTVPYAKSATLSGTGNDLGVVGHQSPSKYRMTGRWDYLYDADPPVGSTTECNP